MSKIDVSQWKEFKIGELLTKVKTKKVPFKALDLPVTPTYNCDLPLVAAGVDNQGRGRYVASKYATVLHGCLTVSANGANSGATFYQDSDFSILQDAYALELVDKYKSMGMDNIYLFLAAVIRQGLINNDWSNKATWTRVQKTIIKLPVTSFGEPDWQYMGSYIAKRAALAHKYVSELKSTKNQRQPLKISGWQEYKLSDLFEPEFTDGDNKVQNLEQSENGINLVGPLNLNNGVLGKFISDTKVFLAGTLTWDMFGKCYEQFEPYQTVSHGHVLVLNPKVKLDKFALLFVASLLTKIGQNSHFGYNNMLTISKFNKLAIKLPALSDGTPDWATMRKRVADLAALSHRDVTSLDPAELPIFVGDWHEFKIGQLFYKLSTKFTGKSKLKRNLAIKPDNVNSLSLVYAKKGNNGIMYYGNPDDFEHHDHCLSVISNGAVSAGMVYPQVDQVGVLAEAYLIKSKFKISDSSLVFLAATLQRSIYDCYDRDNLPVWSKVSRDFITLPVDSIGNPDWCYMDSYIKFMRLISKKQLQAFEQAIKL